MKFSYFFAVSASLWSFFGFAEDMQNKMGPCVQSQGEPLTGCYPAFNAPAAYNVNYKDFYSGPTKTNYYINASFLYWFAGEGGLNIGSSAALNSDVLYYAKDTSILTQPFSFQPGFEVALGAIFHHDWTMDAKYTFIRNTTTMHSGEPLTGTIPTAATGEALSGNSVWILDDWFIQAIGAQSVASKWVLAMDIFDVRGKTFLSIEKRGYISLRRSSLHVDETASCCKSC
jgi:hypothetical protein